MPVISMIAYGSVTKNTGLTMLCVHVCSRRSGALALDHRAQRLFETHLADLPTREQVGRARGLARRRDHRRDPVVPQDRVDRVGVGRAERLGLGRVHDHRVVRVAELVVLGLALRRRERARRTGRRVRRHRQRHRGRPRDRRGRAAFAATCAATRRGRAGASCERSCSRAAACGCSCALMSFRRRASSVIGNLPPNFSTSATSGAVR
jgi:hypothetical protein